MGLEDRDWYREEQRKRLRKTDYFSSAAEPKNWLGIVLFWMFVVFALFKGAQYVERNYNVLPHASTSASIALAETSKIPTVTDAQLAMPQAQISRYDTSPAEGQRTPIIEAKPPGPVTIYHCKAYSGGAFWSSTSCSTQQALLDRTASVPNGMPFEQQVKIGEVQRAEAAALYNQQPSPVVQVSQRCAGLKYEREEIESRYSNWQWQPLEVINPDQTRMRGLRAEQSRLGCPTQ